MNFDKEVAVSDGNVYERLFKLWSAICKMIVDGARDPYKVAEVLQGIIDRPVKVVEVVGDYVTRHFTIDRNRNPEEVFRATGRRQYLNDEVVKAMPRGEDEEGEVVFFKLGRFGDNDLEKEYELRGLNPADPYSIASVNMLDPAFADDHPNATHWKDANGRWCFATFDRHRGERYVGVDRDDSDWDGGWWFAGLRK